MEIIKITKAELKSLTKEENLLEFNRDIQDRYVEKMRISVQECGVLRLPVIGDISKFDRRKQAIIDGQHLCKALEKSKEHSSTMCILKVYENKKQVIDDIAKLNNTQKTWTDEDYLHAWTKFGKDNLTHYGYYRELTKLYNDFEKIPIGFLVDLYAKSKDGFREGELLFRDEDFSLKVLQLAYQLKDQFGKPAHTLHGLSKWAKHRHYVEKRDIDFLKLQSRLVDAVRHGRDKNCNGRDDFYEFVEGVYTKL
jgi:hypothetical protein